ncbi:MAG: tetratricopeptide repeat protein [Bacteroidales bacterium]|nr:tetratricopeptide repeat protein [Candidatus Cryptobacteroides aphodequi]
MKRLILIFVTVLLCLPLAAQADRKDVRAGNRRFKAGDWKESEIDYRKALVKDSTSFAASYNLASSLYRQNDYDGAAKVMENVSDPSVGGEHSSDYNYNLGDIALQRKDYGAAVEAFRKCLLETPDDLDAKENYIYARMMQEQQQQQQNQDQQDQQNQNQNDQQNQQDQQNQDQNDQDQQNQPDDQQDQEDQNQGQQPKISSQQAQQMLQAIQAKEKETQDKVEKQKAAALQSRQKEKNW